MVSPLQELLERNCDLKYYMNMSLFEIEDTVLKELSFYHSWLMKKKKEEWNLSKGHK